MKTSTASVVAAVVIAASASSPLYANEVSNTGSAGQSTSNVAINSPQAAPKSSAEWSYIAQDMNKPEHERVVALEALSSSPSQNALVAVARGLKDPSARIREAAIVAAKPYQLEHRWRLVAPLLADEDHTVRITAAANLVRDYSSLDQAKQSDSKSALLELESYLKAQPDQSSHLFLADVYRWQKQWDKASELYHQVLSEDQKNVQAWLNLADNYRGQGKDKQAINVLNQAMMVAPSNATLHYSKSLALVRLEDKEQAAKEIQIAADMAVDNSYYWYLNGVLQENVDVDISTASFEKAYKISGDPVQLYAVCDMYIRYDNGKAAQCLEELTKIAPPTVIKQLEAKRPS
ncbi:tetratricopeptide repeat protein [Vibrio tapetis]|uniref:Uncharacterized protein n=1 Tax=Vibrio tapetis subsp. tapetis TaxID=1671868 RepID=A0A2N8ZM46_9VIBR|nr:tetratricopeptide repeat protein [Vibrio tapetis]SON52967.1 conserved exported protein of unknown function [Vibrio tapetis subsp. tapetis]